RALAELTTDADRAIVLVEHDVDAALAFATRVIVLDRDGRMLLDGPARQTLHDNAERLHELGVWLPAGLLTAAPHPHISGDLHDLGDPGAIPPELRRTPSERDTAEPAMPAISVRDLVVRKGRETVLRVPELDLAAGAFTAIVGANGAGKATLLQALGGVVPAPRGAAMIGELDGGRATARRLAWHVGFVFQNPEHQFIAHAVRAELAHGLRLQRVDDAEIDARVDEMLDRFGLRYKADEHPFLLSGGEKRRLSVGTALITRPRVVALD